MEKRPWTKPELIVLVRTTPEEAVLSACKHEIVFGPESMHWQCEDIVCVLCSGWNES